MSFHVVLDRTNETWNTLSDERAKKIASIKVNNLFD